MATENIHLLSLSASAAAEAFRSLAHGGAPFADGFRTFVAGFLSLPVTAGFFFSAILIVMLSVILLPLKILFGFGGTFGLFLPAAALLAVLAALFVKYLLPVFARVAYARTPAIPLAALRFMTREKVGMKSKGLGELDAAGLDTAPGFVLNGDVFGAWIRKNRLAAKIESAAKSDDAAGAIASLFAKHSLPRRVRRAIKKELKCLKCDELIVRSSFLDEDGSRTSMAGVYKSVTARAELRDVTRAIGEVWASYFSAAADSARRKNDIAPSLNSLPVIVQKHIRCDATFIVSSANIVNGHSEEALIDYETAAGKPGVAAYSYLTNGIAVFAGSPEPPFGSDTLRELADAARRLEARFGVYVQIEAGLTPDGGLCFFQVRPLTAFNAKETFVNSFVVDITDRPLTPFSESLFGLPGSVRNRLAEKLKRFGGGRGELLVRRGGRFYLRYNSVRKYLNPYYLSQPGFAAGAFSERLNAAVVGLRVKKIRRTADKVRAELSDGRNIGLVELRNGYAVPVFVMQMDLFYLVDAARRSAENFVSKVIGLDPDTAWAEAGAAETPYGKLTRAAAGMDWADEWRVEAFRREFGHWGENEAEAGAPRLSENPAMWAGGSPAAWKADSDDKVSALLGERWKGYPLKTGVLLYGILRKRYRAAVAAREDVRDLLNLIVSRARAAALEAGHGEDVFFATIDEIVGSYPARDVIEKRRREYEDALKAGAQAVIHEPEDEASAAAAPDLICGMGIGSADAAGPALVSPETKGAPAGEKPVLVISRPDPAYGVMVGGIAALVIERGSPLSHLVILAREEGVSVLVGAAGACGRLCNGDKVVVDPRKGVLRIER